MSAYAIGDVQGCHAQLRALLDEVHFDPARDVLWFVGDLVNRGPDSLGVLRLVKSLGDAAIAVLGNHDLHLLARSLGLGRAHRSDTLDAILDAPDRLDLIDWLRTRPLAHAEGEWLLVHAGVLPAWSAADATRLALEVQRALAAPDWSDFMTHLYGNEPRAWDESLTGFDRLRVIVNALTRMRYVTARGEMEFHHKGAPGSQAPGLFAWFDAPRARPLDRTVICGHWSTLGLRLEPGLMALDTGCLWGGTMTAVRLEDRRAFQLPCPTARRPGK
jgi:bis(5'-nucleosyl)-tetraphosphatase (symmetrical)